jgi:hypothetical protein
VFDSITKRLFGEQVWSTPVAGGVEAEVYIWKRKERYTLRIWSKRGSYASGVAGNWTALWFEPSEVQALIDAIGRAKTQMNILMQKGI